MSTGSAKLRTLLRKLLTSTCQQRACCEVKSGFPANSVASSVCSATGGSNALLLQAFGTTRTETQF